jgi:hypothetical protein
MCPRIGQNFLNKIKMKGKSRDFALWSYRI